PGRGGRQRHVVRGGVLRLEPIARQAADVRPGARLLGAAGRRRRVPEVRRVARRPSAVAAAGRGRPVRVGRRADPGRPGGRLVPAVCHVDGSGRLQSVSRAVNPEYWQLIKTFERHTGVPMLLNTSLNENEPIVCTPEEAIQCFLRTKMDAILLGSYLVERK